MILSKDVSSTKCFFAFVSADTHNQFNARESDWGFTSFMPLSELYDPSRGYLVNDTVLQEGAITIHLHFRFLLHFTDYFLLL